MMYRSIITIHAIIFLCSFAKEAIAQPNKFSLVPGVVIDHSPAQSRLYIGSPGICILPNGKYLASGEYFGPAMTGKPSETFVFLSEDRGVNWKKINTIKGIKWAQPFMYGGQLHLIGTEKSGGDAIIVRSPDNGFTWTTPLDSITGRILKGRCHTAPTPVVFHNGRVWKAMEDMEGPKGKWGNSFRTFMMSAPIGSDLLKRSSWTISNTLAYNASYLNGNFNGWLEGNAVPNPEGNIVNILRTDYRVDGNEKASIIQISNDGANAVFDTSAGFIDFPGGCKKFSIRYDSVSKKYWSLSNYIPTQYKGNNPERTRNTLALIWSANLQTWHIQGIVLFHPDIAHHGFQYADFQFEGKDIIAVSRTAYDDGEAGADNQHNANFLTFHRIEGFRQFKTRKEWLYLLLNYN